MTGAEADEALLWRRFKDEGQDKARETLFTLHYPFARQLARRHFLDRRSGDIEFGDLCQLASAGLLEALDHYDPARGAPFRPYAARRISGSILDGLAKMSEMREQISFRNRLRAERTRSLSTGDGEGMSAGQALEALAELAVGLAVGFMLEDAGLHHGEDAPKARLTAYDSLAWKETVRRMLAEVAALPERERMIIRSHYMDDLGFEQIGAVLGVSKGRVSQLHRAAVTLLRKRLRAAGEFKLER